MHDDTYKCTDSDAQKIAELAEELSLQIYEAKGTDTTRFIQPVVDISYQLCNLFYAVSDGLSISEYCKVIDRYLNSINPFYNTKCKNVYFKPMKQLIDYLHENEFCVIVLTGTDRTFARQLLCDTFNIER